MIGTFCIFRFFVFNFFAKNKLFLPIFTYFDRISEKPAFFLTSIPLNGFCCGSLHLDHFSKEKCLKNKPFNNIKKSKYFILSHNTLLKCYATNCYPKQLRIYHQYIYLKFSILQLITRSTTICLNLTRNAVSLSIVLRLFPFG